jgi:hypothetical protein
MDALMKNVEIKSFTNPDHHGVLPDNLGEAQVLNFQDGETKISRMRVLPGWRWSTHMKEMMGTESCLVPHLGVITSGSVRVLHDDGTEATYGAGDAYMILPGHDAWVEGNEPVEGFEFSGGWTESLPSAS